VTLVEILHLLILVALVVVLPIWDRGETRRLKTSTDPRVRVQSYRKIVAYLWAMALVLLATIPFQQLFTAPPLPVDLGRWRGSGLALGITISLAIGLILPVILVRRSPEQRSKVLAPLRAIAFFLPRTGEERAWFAAVSVTAGICEEIIFRGFLIRYLDALPLGLGIWAGAVVAAVIFGIDHGYQGWTGMITTGIMALVFTALFFITGTLWIPIVIHALVDLRILALLPPDSPDVFGPLPAASEEAR
jgi:membrane protease YdiL (CAAX protease family)